LALRVLLAGGGTGGHFYPAWALIEALRERYGSEIRIAYVGTRRGLEACVLAEHPEIEFFPIRARGFERRPSPQLGPALIENVWGMLQALWVIERFRPQLVIGTGGYAAFAPVFWASTLRIPTVIHEQNALPGLVTRLLAPLVDRIWLTYPETAQLLKAPTEALSVTGVPLRASVLRAQTLNAKELKRSLGLDPARPLVLVLGGSHGARPLHEALLSELRVLIRSGAQLAILAGRETARLRAQLTALPHGAGKHVHVVGHTPEIARWMRAADVAISRAGGATLAELMTLGVPTIAVPWPGAAGGHQEHNARWWAERGACRLLLESHLEKLAREVLALLQDEAERQRMSQRARALSRPEALDQMIREVECCLDQRTLSPHRYRRGWHERLGLGASRPRPLRPRL
jgi:UDP-N-acetylglucosamine--N-acetylmuramyl-(pentapeptide) pyrophosphoryl-undecaprenol N-acetylglucosamine transferase